MRVSRCQYLVPLALFAVLLAYAPTRAPAQADLAVGASYTSVPPITTASSGWWLGEDPPNVKFTDGASVFDWGYMTGWQGPDGVSSVTLVLDLGSVRTDLGNVRVDEMVSHASTVYESDWMKCYGSVDGVNYDYWGELFAPNLGDDETILNWIWTAPAEKTARYVKYELDWPAANQYSHKLLSEIYVYQFIVPPTSVRIPWQMYY